MTLDVIAVGYDESKFGNNLAWVRKQIPEIGWKSFDSVLTASEALDSGKYLGVYIENLEIPWGPRDSLEKYFKKLEVWKEELSEPRGSGLYLAKYALQNQLPVLAIVPEGNKEDITSTYPMEIVEYLPAMDTFSDEIDLDFLIKMMRKTFLNK